MLFREFNVRDLCFFRESYILWSFMAMYFGAVSCEGKAQSVLDV